MAKEFTIAELAAGVGGRLIVKKSCTRIALGTRTLVYVNKTNLDFRAGDVTQAPKASRDKLTIRGTRATLPLAETKAAAVLLKHVAEAHK